jgi:hypothetical protein
VAQAIIKPKSLLNKLLYIQKNFSTNSQKLITNKLNDYKLFKLAYILILKKEHLTLEGIKKLVSIKSSMNLGLSPLVLV